MTNKSSTQKSNNISLKNFPRKLKNPTDNDCDFHLLGIVSYKGPSKIAETSSDLAHHTALCLVDGTWYEFDNLHATMKRLSSKKKVFPEVLIYTTVKC